MNSIKMAWPVQTICLFCFSVSLFSYFFIFIIRMPWWWSFMTCMTDESWHAWHGLLQLVWRISPFAIHSRIRLVGLSSHLHYITQKGKMAENTVYACALLSAQADTHGTKGKKGTISRMSDQANAQNIDDVRIFGDKHEEATVHCQGRRTLHFLQKHTFENYLIFIPTFVNRTYEIQVSWRSEIQTVSEIQVQNVFVKAAKFNPLKMYSSLLVLISKTKQNKTKTSSMFWACSVVMAKGLII